MSDETDRATPKPPPVDRLSLLWRRVRDHKIVQWSVAYIAVAYAVQQGVVLMAGAFAWPEAVLRVSMLLMIIGLPVVMTLAWYHGERASRHFSAGELTIISLLLVIGAVVFYSFVQPQAEVAADAAPAMQQDGVAKARAAAQSPVTGISLAVLPFANLSDDETQTFFSDGITEEIITALARIPDLRVVARESASQFKGERRDLRAVGQTLGATHLIEGSVRKAGDRVRITARLVRADDGVNAWVNSFDRELTDVFAIQEEIAASIAGALRMPLGLRPGEKLVANRAIDPESYEQFLRGKAALLQAQRAFAEQLALLEPVVAKNPNYAPAWAALSQAYAFAAATASETGSPEERARTRAAYREKMVAAARRAIELDPDLVDAQVQYTVTISGPRRLALIEDALTRALALDPNHPNALERYSSMLMAVGRVKEAVALKQQLHDLDPFIPVRNNNFAEALWLDGQTDAAIALLKDSIGRVGRPGIGAEVDLARIYAAMGRYEDAAQTLSLIVQSERPQQLKDLASAAMRLLRSAPANAADPDGLPRQAGLSFIYLNLGMPERALEPYEEGPLTSPVIAYLWHPSNAPLRKLDRFKTIMRDEGLVAYWRERGWPQWCRPTTADDFECS